MYTEASLQQKLLIGQSLNILQQIHLVLNTASEFTKENRGELCSDLVWYKLSYCHLEKDNPHKQLANAETRYIKIDLKNNQLARRQQYVPDFDILCGQSIIKFWTILKKLYHICTRELVLYF